MTTMTTTQLLERHADAWREATRHPFLDGVRTGDLPAHQFEAWLAQDHHFVSDLVPFQARLLARSPRPAQKVLADGLVALVAELGWFEEQAGKRGLDLPAPRHPTTAAYGKLLDDLDGAAYPVALLALWALERAYLDAWTFAAPGGGPYRDVVAHWVTPQFAAYVAGLALAANQAADTQTLREEGPAEEAFLRVARLERDFWAIGG